jgi:Fe-S-cluster-containing dehydrogenase component
MFVRTIGGGGIDEAGGKWPNLYLKWNPVYSQKCAKCHGDASTGNIPYCVYNCPTGALMYGDTSDAASDIAKRKEELLDNGYHTWEQPEWECTRDGVVYMENGI